MTRARAHALAIFLVAAAVPHIGAAQAPRQPAAAEAPAHATPAQEPAHRDDGPWALPPIVLGDFRLRIGGYAQAQYQADQSADTQLAADGTHLLNRDAFVLRRGRLVVQLERSVAKLLLELDGSGSPDAGLAVRVIRAEATVQWPESTSEPWAALTAGLFRTPFGEEVVRSPRDRLFLEGSTVTRALFPGETDLGVRVQGSLYWLRYVVAVVNGHPIDEARFGGRAPTPSGDVLGRLGAVASIGDAQLAAGFSLLRGTGFHPGTPATKDTLVVHSANESGMLGASDLTLIPGRAATPSLTYDRWAVGADVALTGSVGADVAFWLRAEAIVSSNLDRGLYPADPIATGYDVRELGVTASLVQLFWRVLLVGFRLDYYDPFMDAQSRVGGALTATRRTVTTGSFVVGAQWPRSQTRLLLEYDRVLDHLALGGDGLPADLQNDRVTARLQVAF